MMTAVPVRRHRIHGTNGHRNNRNQFLRLAMPATAEVWSVAVGGNTVAPAKDEQGKLLIPLIRSARGGRELASFPVEIVSYM